MNEIAKRYFIEIIKEEELEELIDSGGGFGVYYGTAPTGPVHIGYLIPLMKLYDLSKFGAKPKILIADIHSALDDLKTSWEEIDKKAEYYKKCLELVSRNIGLNVEFLKGSDYQFERDYQYDLLKMSTMVTIKRGLRAASEVCRLKNPKISEIIYPLMQALDEEYLDVDMQIGGSDQRHIMMLAREYLPQLGYKRRVEAILPVITSLVNPEKKMSASNPNSHIKVYESEENIRKKIRKAYCPTGVIDKNPILDIVKYLIIPLNGKIKIKRKYGEDLEFENYEELEKYFKNKEIHPLDLKNAVAENLIEMLKPVREYFKDKEEELKQFGDHFV